MKKIELDQPAKKSKKEIEAKRDFKIKYLSIAFYCLVLIIVVWLVAAHYHKDTANKTKASNLVAPALNLQTNPSQNLKVVNSPSSSLVSPSGTYNPESQNSSVINNSNQTNLQNNPTENSLGSTAPASSNLQSASGATNLYQPINSIQ